VRAELAQLGASLPAAFEAILPQLRSEGLDAAVDYYRHFVAYAKAAASGEAQAAVDAAPEDLPDVLPTLAEVREGRTARPIERDTAEAAAAPAPAVEIDWDAALTCGDGDSGAAAGGAAAAEGGSGIDWDLDLSDLVVAGGGEHAGADPAADAGDGGGGPAISWDIELTEAAAADVEAAGGGGAEPAPVDPPPRQPVAVDVEAAVARLAADADYRAALNDDLQELRAFLTQRRAELRGGGAEMLHALLPPAVAAVDARDAARLLAAVEGALSALGDPQLRQLLLIAGSSRYLDRLSRELGRKAGQEAKMLAAAKEADARRHESRAALAALAPRSSALAERTRTAQRGVESALSAQLGRRVHILGEINSVLAAAAKAAVA
jgi:hypothetical protein